jgi:hypothetical protein
MSEQCTRDKSSVCTADGDCENCAANGNTLDSIVSVPKTELLSLMFAACIRLPEQELNELFAKLKPRLSKDMKKRIREVTDKLKVLEL